MQISKKHIVIILNLILPLYGIAQPDFGNSVEIDGIKCFRDAKNINTAYYTPGTLSLKYDHDGKPDFKFLETRYTGNAAYNDRGEIRFLSILRFKVIMDHIPSEKLSRIKKTLWPHGGGHLRPLPVTSVKTMLVFIPVAGENENTDSLTFTRGDLSADNTEGLNSKGEYWRERDYYLKVDDQTAQLLSKSFELGSPLISLSYAFFSSGVNIPQNKIITEGEDKILKDIEKHIKENQDTTIVEQICVRSDAFPVTVDTHKWPDLVKQIDINEEIPPGYAALEVRCYDFYNGLRPDLFAKKIEIKAQGVGHGDVIIKKTFSSKTPDIYVYNITFPYAVRLDKPLFYRVTTISDNSPPEKTQWKQQNSWTSMIDITSSPEQIVKHEDDDMN